MKKIILPKTIFGAEVKGAMQRVLSGNKVSKNDINLPAAPSPSINGFVYVPSINLYVAKERSLHEKNWNQAHEELQKQGNQMLTIPDFWKFVDYLKNGYSDKNEAQRILDNLFKVGKWRAEWLDASFEKKGKDLYINSLHRFNNGDLTPQNSEKLEHCLEDCYADLNSINNQGLLTQKSPVQDLSFQDREIKIFSHR